MTPCVVGLLAALALPQPVQAGETDLSYQLRDAAAQGDTVRVERLLVAGAQPDAWALDLAAVGGHAGVAKALLAAGAAPDAPLESGASYPPRTALLSVATYGQTEVVRVLVQAGADLRAGRGSDRLTPLGAALRFGKLETAAALVTLGAPVDAEITHCGTPEICGFLLAHGASAKATDARGITALHLSIFPGQASVIALLLEAGADVNARDSSGTTPLMRAAAFCQPAAIRLLLAKGAQVDARDEQGVTALMDAVTPCSPYASIRFEPQSVKLLLEAGADPDWLDASQRSARTRVEEALARFLAQPAATALAEIKTLLDRHPRTPR